MIAALFALAAAMIIGGCAAVIQGFPYVRLESGLAMVIAGSVAASSGAVLLGLGVVALGFRRLERAMGRVPAVGERPAAPAPVDEVRTVLVPEPDHRPEPDAKAGDAIAPEDDLFAAPEPPPPSREEPHREPETASPEELPALRPSLDTPPEPEPAPKAAPRTVVGRYASGGNTYVMFEDGSIEAETPQGRFTFASLDELKAFVDGGGESGTRGAA
ncbi:hypothetical protein MOF8_05985 [Methylobacterium oryzae]|uniref:hypothetical protein n=1 Tax=Methylobacterium oryzae TaxID=334852 RepID=UPI002F32760C